MGCWMRAPERVHAQSGSGARSAPQFMTACPPSAQPRLTLACPQKLGDLEQLCMCGEKMEML